MKRTASVAAGVVGIGAAIVLVVLGVSRTVGRPGQDSMPQVLTVERVSLSPGRIELVVRNGGRAPVRVAQLAVNDAYWQFEVDRAEIPRLETARVRVDYPWERGEPLTVKMVSADGQTVSHAVEFPVVNPALRSGALGRYVPMGLFMGVVPVAVGLAARPFFRRSQGSLWHFFLAFTIGVLVAIGVEAGVELFETSGRLADAISGRLLAVTVAAVSFVAISEIARAMRDRAGLDEGTAAAWTLAGAIGMHNMGEGLAVAGAEAAGAVAVGALLAMGFAVHNLSEGVAIAAAMGPRAVPYRTVAGVTLLAGLPAVVGLLVGSRSPSDLATVVLVAVGVGAIAEVVVEVRSILVKRGPGEVGTLTAVGVAAGLLFMYVTSLAIT